MVKTGMGHRLSKFSGPPTLEPMQLHLSAALKHFLASLDDSRREQARQSVEKEAASILKQTSGSERAQPLHRRLDDAIQAFLTRRPDLTNAIRCGKGCSHCCRVFVGITRDEAQLLAAEVRAGRASFDSERMEIQRHWASAEDFATHPREEATCIFLQGDGSCGVYAHRPAACRALLVASDPEFCRQAERSSQVLAIINPHAEWLVSAAHTADAAERGSEPNLLARRVWEALQA